MSEGWQPIETAPKEREALFSDGFSVEAGKLNDGEVYATHGGRLIDEDELYLKRVSFRPTHWMPLPTPPA